MLKMNVKSTSAWNFVSLFISTHSSLRGVVDSCIYGLITLCVSISIVILFLKGTRRSNKSLFNPYSVTTFHHLNIQQWFDEQFFVKKVPIYTKFFKFLYLFPFSNHFFLSWEFFYKSMLLLDLNNYIVHVLTIHS